MTFLLYHGSEGASPSVIVRGALKYYLGAPRGNLKNYIALFNRGTG